MPVDRLARLEAITHRDPGGRGLASYRRGGEMLDAGQLRAAASQPGRIGPSSGDRHRVLAPGRRRVTAETDGPPGALFLARALAALRLDVTIVTDRYALPLVERREFANLDRVELVEFPLRRSTPEHANSDCGDQPCDCDAWIEAFLNSASWPASLTHLMAIERPRRATPPSRSSRSRAPTPCRASDLLPPFRPSAAIGATTCVVEPIDTLDRAAHLLFEAVGRRRPDVVTIGIGDGGNELGMGHYAWELLVAAMGGQQAGANRRPGRYPIRPGGRSERLGGLRLGPGHGPPARWATTGAGVDAAAAQALIEAIVAETQAVDGITLLRQPTVDALPLEVYLRPLVG